MSRNAILSRIKCGRWRQIYPGVYSVFTGPVNREAQLWAAVLYAGKGAQLSHETAAELNRLSDRQSSPIHVSIPVARRVRPVKGIIIHRSGHIDAGARFPRGVIPHTLTEETIIDLVNEATTLDDVIGWVTVGFGKRLTGEGPLRKTLSTRQKLRWRDRL